MPIQKQIARTRGLLHGAASDPRRAIINGFHSLYYRSVIQDTWYHGVQILKSPLDLWVYQEILCEQPVDLVIETGTFNGGSALYLAHLMDRLDRGRVITLDINEHPDRPQHPRIEYLIASSTDPATVTELAAEASKGRTMVVLDSDHSRDHVLAEMRCYADLVTPGSYMIVEDGNVNGHPVYVDHGPGPQEAIAAFLAERDGFTVDRSREKFLLTMNPGGYLLRE